MQDLLFDENEKILATICEKELETNVVASSFYITPNNAQLLSQLRQFLATQESTCLLIGGKSSGKTTVLRLLEKEEKKTLLIDYRNKIQLTALLSDQPPLEEGFFTDDNIDSLLTQLNVTSDSLHLIIDDAEDLPAESLQKLIALFSNQFNPLHKLYLAGNAALVSTVEMLCQKNNLKGPANVLWLKPLCLKNTKQFIQKTLNYLPNYEKKKINKQIKRIQMLSEGYPGRIIRVATQILATHNPEKSYLSAKKQKSAVDLLLMVGILLLLGVIGFRIALLYLEDRTDPEPVVQTKSQPLPLKPKRKVITKQPVANFIDEEQAAPSFIASIENLPEEIINKPSVPAVPPPNPVASPYKQLQSPTKPASPVQVSQSKGYTVQVMAADEKATLIAWAKKMNLGNQFQVHFIKRQNKSWYVLTYGTFEGYKAAKQAISQLPPVAQTQHPWVRSLREM